MKCKISLLLCLGSLLLTAACGSAPAATSTASPAIATTAPRISSPAKIAIISPTNGEVIHGDTMTVTVSLTGAQISPLTTTNITPTLGHVHLYIDGALTIMSYSLTSPPITVRPGQTYAVYCEFVASDHGPFNPRVLTPTIFVTAAPA